MKRFKILFNAVLIFVFILFSACAKGYQVRVSNYNTEILDSVIIGNNEIVFTQIGLQSTTEYRNIKSGDKTIKCITKTKKKYNSSISIPKKDSGKRTMQIDGINSISVLED